MDGMEDSPFVAPAKNVCSPITNLNMKRLLAFVSCALWSVALFGQTTIYQIRINEVLAAGATRVNAAGHPSTIVEMYNPGGDAVNIAGCGLTDHNLNPKYI